jgi:myo-inositol 2-dehydrogenase/D-chiro-inositol 1-dehydrogenase
VFGYDQRVEVFGSSGGVEAFNESPCQVRHRGANRERAENPLYFFLERYRQSFVAELEAFFDSIRNGTTPPVTGRDGLIPVLIGIAAGRSMRENRPVSVEAP